MKRALDSIWSIVKIIGVTVMIFVLLEGILRATHPKLSAKYRLWGKKEVLYRYNENYFIELRPNISGKYYRKKANGGDIISWRSNENSHRGDVPKKVYDKRVIVFGDSNIMARFSSLKNTFPAKLEDYLIRNSNLNFDVINAGTLGFGPDQSFLRMKEDIHALRPDIVIFHVFADNDYGDMIRNKMLYVDQNNSLRQFERDIEKEMNLFEGLKKEKFLKKLLIYQCLESISLNAFQERIASGMVETFDIWCQEEYDVYLGKEETDHLFGDHYDVDLATDPELESSKQKVRLLRAILTEANELATLNDAAFVVLIQPSATDITANYYFDHALMEQKYQDYSRKRLTGIAENICREANINYINLYDDFVSNSPNELYFTAGDNHWNDKGQDLAAEITAAYLLDPGFAGM
jgi:hypothetical protein